ncbi:MAG: phosphatase PAP2 family protein [Bacteroidales bacterium]|nr:phosphatase PAP2 family protein [Bacteroidales bacterium]
MKKHEFGIVYFCPSAPGTKQIIPLISYSLCSNCINGIQEFDIRWLKIINTNRDTSYDVFYKTITDTAPIIAFAIPAFFLLWFLIYKNRIQSINWLGALLAISFAALIATVLKFLINRPRPFESYDFIEKLSGGGNPSFPSGHTTDAFALAMVLIMIRPRWYVVIPAFVWATLTAYSRMHLGVHYPSDVIAGALLGIITAGGCLLFYRRIFSQK